MTVTRGKNPGEFYNAAIDKTFVIRDLYFVRRDQPLPKGALVCAQQPATYAARVQLARTWATDPSTGHFDPVFFRERYPSSRHTLLVSFAVGR